MIYYIYSNKHRRSAAINWRSWDKNVGKYTNILLS